MTSDQNMVSLFAKYQCPTQNRRRYKVLATCWIDQSEAKMIIYQDDNLCISYVHIFSAGDPSTLGNILTIFGLPFVNKILILYHSGG